LEKAWDHLLLITYHCLLKILYHFSAENLPIEPEDCVWGHWSTWSSCSKLCGVGTNTRSRKKIEIEQNGGNCSGSGRDSKPCNTHSCSKVPEVLSLLAAPVATAGGAFAVASFIAMPPLPMTLASGIPPGKLAINYQLKYFKAF
jgi:hypothetical protein